MADKSFKVEAVLKAMMQVTLPPCKRQALQSKVSRKRLVKLDPISLDRLRKSARA